MKPILTRSEVTDAVYIVTKYKVLEDGLVDTIEKYDVTNQFDAMTEPLRAENAKLRELCADMWVLLCVSGNDDLVIEAAHNDSPLRVIDADEISACLRDLGVDVG